MIQSCVSTSWHYHGFVSDMVSAPNELDRHDIVRRLYVQIAARLENRAEIAVEGQGEALTPTEQLDHADRLRTVAQEVGLLAAAIHVILGNSDHT